MVENLEFHRSGLAVPVRVDAVAQCVDASLRDERRLSRDHDFFRHGDIRDDRDKRSQSKAGAIDQFGRLRHMVAHIAFEIVERDWLADESGLVVGDGVVGQAL